MGKLVYDYDSPLAEYARGYADEISNLLEGTDIDPAMLYQEFLSCSDEKKYDFIRGRDLGPYKDSIQDYILVFWRLTQLESEDLSWDVKEKVGSLIYNLSSCYDWGYRPHPREMAQELRQGLKNDFTQVMRSLIRYLLPSHPIAQNLALTLIQPNEFERCQSKVFKGVVHFKAVVDKCEDGRVLCIRDQNGKEKTYRLRSLETLIGKVKKEQEASK